jgi:hypothetical protein
VKLISKITIIIKNGGKGRNKTKVLARTTTTNNNGFSFYLFVALEEERFEVMRERKKKNSVCHIFNLGSNLNLIF